MYAPLRIAAALADELDGWATVRYSSTTRSPVVAVDDPGYAIRNRLSFPARRARRVAIRRRPTARARALPTTSPARRRTSGSATSCWSPTPTWQRSLRRPAGLVGQLASVTDHLQIVRLPAHRPLRLPLQG